MWVIRFKIINMRCLNLIPKAYVMVVAAELKSVDHVGGYRLVPSSVQPRDVTSSIFYSSGSFRFRPVLRTGNFYRFAI